MKNKLFLELIWWIFTAVVAFAVLYPIWSKVTVYPEYINYINVAYIIVGITLTRYIFLLKYTFIAENQYIKAALIIASIPLIIYSIDGVFTFRTIIDNDGFEAICKGVVDEQVVSLGMYYRNEYIFFGITSVISSILFPIRMIVSIWRQRNRGTV
jgi:hypothetical protein